MANKATILGFLKEDSIYINEDDKNKTFLETRKTKKEALQTKVEAIFANQVSESKEINSPCIVDRKIGGKETKVVYVPQAFVTDGYAFPTVYVEAAISKCGYRLDLYKDDDFASRYNGDAAEEYWKGLILGITEKRVWRSKIKRTMAS